MRLSLTVGRTCARKATGMRKARIVTFLIGSVLLVSCGTADPATPAAGAAVSTSNVSQASPTAVSTAVAATKRPTATAQATPTTASAAAVDDNPTPEPDQIYEGIVSASFPKIADVGELAWYASVIVVGRVQSVGEPYFIQGSSRPTIATDYAVAVDTPVRGVVGDSVGVRQFGGTIGECTQSYEDDPAFAIGERVLLLLIAEPDGQAGVARLYPAFGKQGVWAVNTAGMAISGAPHMQTEPQPLTDVLAEIVAALQGTPPSGRLADQYLTTLEEAPIVYDGTASQ